MLRLHLYRVERLRYAVRQQVLRLTPPVRTALPGVMKYAPAVRAVELVYADVEVKLANVLRHRPKSLLALIQLKIFTLRPARRRAGKLLV